MTYIGLTDTYRPKQFRQVIGQPDAPVVRAIFADLEELPALLLFCGLSGVGKTTVARIIAARVNCESPTPEHEPCTKCASCEAVRSGTHHNVEELDAATNGSAEKLRDLVQRAHLQSSGIKTFIIDEAQSISAQGWNVLLKVLEEPPPNCLFILLTSEPRKVPTKIRTRALRFNLKQVSPAVLKQYIPTLVAHAGVNVTTDDIDVAIDLCGGSVRDALMLLEQVSVSGFTAEQLFGSSDLSLDYFDAITQQEYDQLLTIVDKWWEEVNDAKTILSQMSLTLEKVAHVRTGIEIFGGVTTAAKFKELSTSITMNKIAVCLESISDWYTQSYSKAQVLLLSARLYKAVNGSAISITKTEATHDAAPKKIDNAPQFVGVADIKSQLAGL